MSQSWVIAMFVAVVLVLMLAFTLLDIWTAKPDEPNYGLALVVEDPTEDDPMDAYLEQRAAGNGVLPVEPEVSEPERFRPHTACVDRWLDGEPHRVHARCREAIEAGVPQ